MKLIGNTSVFEIKLLYKSNPESDNEWDRKWIKIELNINLNGFNANQFLELLDEDFNSFSDSLKQSLKDFSRPIEFNTLEESLFLQGKIQEGGQVLWEGYSIYPIGDGNKLSFRFETELIQIENLYDNLQKEIRDLQ